MDGIYRINVVCPYCNYSFDENVYSTGFQLIKCLVCEERGDWATFGVEVEPAVIATFKVNEV